MFKNNGNNNGGNPYHDENGHFTSKGNEGSGANRWKQTPKTPEEAGVKMPEEGRLDNMYRPTDSKYPNRGKTESPFANSSKVLNQMGLSDIDVANATYEAKRDLAYKGGWKPDREGNPKNDVNHFLINKSLDNLKKGYSMETDVESPVNKEWAEDLGYQLKVDGVPEEAIPELLDIFKSEAPSWEEAHQKQSDQKALDDLSAKMDKLEGNSKVFDQMGLDSEEEQEKNYQYFGGDVFGTDKKNKERVKSYLNEDGTASFYLDDDAVSKGLLNQALGKGVALRKTEETPNGTLYTVEPLSNVSQQDFEKWLLENTGEGYKPKDFVNTSSEEEQNGDNKVLNQMGLDDKDFGDSNGSNQVSPSSKVKTTPEQDGQINQVVNEIFPGKDWRYLMDNTDSPMDIRMGINDFLETGNKDTLLRVLKELKDRYNYYRVPIK